jgi:hypothetical protein
MYIIAVNYKHMRRMMRMVMMFLRKSIIGAVLRRRHRPGAHTLLHMFLIHAFRHAIKVDQQRQKDLISGRAVFVYSREVAEDGYAGHVFTVESKDRVGGGAQADRVRGRDGAVQVLVLPVVGGGDLGQKRGYHLYHVADGHAADLVPPLVFITAAATRRRRVCAATVLLG